MSNFIELKCTNCGGELVQNPQDNTYACKMCSAKYMLKFEHGGIQIERILDSKLEGVQAGVSVVASEMAIQRLREDIRSHAQEIAKLDPIVREQEHQLRKIPNLIEDREHELAEVKIPKERKYNLVSTLSFFILGVFLTCLSTLTINTSSSISFFFVAGLTSILGWRFFGVLRARSGYKNETRLRLSDEIQHLRHTGASYKTSYKDTKTQLHALKKEVAEKQIELEWHLQNVKMKRD